MKFKHMDGACIVLENYLDGTLADMEQGGVDNYPFVYDCIMGLRELGDLAYADYLDRFNKLKEINK